MPRRQPPGSESFHFLPFVVEKLSHEIESLHSSGHVITLSPAAALSPRRQIFCIATRPEGQETIRINAPRVYSALPCSMGTGQFRSAGVFFLPGRFFAAARRASAR